MKVLMLGWEYPPHITGGLGTACEGLTLALSRLNVEVDFVVPELVGGEHAPHMNLMGSWDLTNSSESNPPRQIAGGGVVGGGVTTHRIPAMLMPYWNQESFQGYLSTLRELEEGTPFTLALSNEQREKKFQAPRRPPRTGKRHYSEDIFQEVAHYASNVLTLASRIDFDVIHAHDWMTFPAGVALSKATGKPLVSHVHSLEYDRSGSAGNTEIRDIERLGVINAQAVIAVSHYTQTVIQREHEVPANRLHVVHNGIYPKSVKDKYLEQKAANGKKIVLFLGRVTFQKGPDYFVDAAAKVIPHIPNVLFVMAGAGDMLPRIVRRVQELGIEDNFEFTGFLKGEEVESMFSLADLYVMPSVSEPFGLTALEAISHDTPVIISRQSGVSEVLNHALKVDFWDVERMSDLIINALLHEELRENIVSMAHQELRRLRWDTAALKTEQIYRQVAQ